MTTVQQIRKRDGRVVPFHENKIADAINKAFEATYKPGYEETAQRLAHEVASVLEVEGSACPDVEHIQDIVERVLMDNGYVQTAKAYILYRSERSRAREMNTRLMKIYEDITFSSAKDSDIKRENANIDGDTAMGTMLKYGSEGSKQFYQMFVMKPEHAAAHQNGDIHIHDMDFAPMGTTTCTQIDLIQLFDGGFSTGHGTLREPNDIASYAALACIAIQSNQNDQHGGQSIVNFDYGMAVGVRKTFKRIYRQNLSRALMLLAGQEDLDTQLKEHIQKLEEETGLYPKLEDCEDFYAAELPYLMETYGVDEALARKCQEFAHYRAVKETDRATYQSMEALIHNLNTMHSRAGAQTPFSSINYGMDTSPEGRMVMKNIMLSTEAGLGNGETPIFPIQIFRVKEGINYNPGEPNYDLFQLAMRCSAKRLFPNFSFQDAPFNLQYYKEGHPETEIAYMGCRTRVIGNVYDPSREISNGRGNLSFTTLNLPRLGIKAKGDLNLFFESLDYTIDLCIEQLLERFEFQCRKRVMNAPFLMGQGVWIDSEKLAWDDEVREVLKHGTLSMGFIGLAETLKVLIGEHHGESEKARVLGLEIVGHMRARMDAESKKRGMNFTLLATPAEGLSGRFVKIDKEKYGVIEGVTDREYYTNSFHIPVYYPISAYDKIAYEAPYHALTNAGHISYVEMDGDPTENLDAFEQIIRCMKEKGIGYGSVNHPVDRDPVCGFSGIIGDQCPGCGRKEDDGVPFERIRRITGYLVGTLDRFNNAKRAEEHDRVKHI
ncbi:MAG: anaerobic ribonucleoside triphosphate reductase [Ruminiclostridium sp.]|nr:anaerobic ribonucleoside triphosphate reductase [Ruminiclostridium sp.]